MVDIINYRGGRALVIDSLDLVRMDRDWSFRKPLLQLVDTCRPYVDYILLITSTDIPKLPTELREVFFAHRGKKDGSGAVLMDCYRINLGTEYHTKHVEELLAQSSGMEEVIKKLRRPSGAALEKVEAQEEEQ